MTEGLDSTYVAVKNTIKSGSRRPQRRRLPRPFTGDRVLRPFNLHAALGQALLYETSIANMPSGGGGGGGGSTSRAPASSSALYPFRNEAYEHHFLLGGSQVLLVTSRRVLLLEAPEFIETHNQLLRGEGGGGGGGAGGAGAAEVQGGQFLWQLPWEGLLAAELRWSQTAPGQAEGIVLHRKRRGGPENGVLHDLRLARSGQAQEVLAAIQACR